MNYVYSIAFATIVVIFVWARLKFFIPDKKTTKISLSFYDPAVAIHVIMTIYLSITNFPDNTSRAILAIAFLSLSLTIFTWSIRTANNFDLAFSNHINNLITTGPFSLVRHPFYLSYILAWSSATLLFSSVILWITLIYLTVYYYKAASREESVILLSDYSREYKTYCKRAGMFYPRIEKWKS